MPSISEAELTRRRHEILEPARRCFAQYGYDGATVRRLEEATGKSRGAIFHHFGDKETLFLAIASLDATRQAEVVATEGLVEVMRDMLNHPERHDWLSTRLEITRKLRTDESFRQRWEEHQSVLDAALRQRLASRSDTVDSTSLPVLHSFLETVLEGFITRLASGESVETLAPVLDLVEETIRHYQDSGEA